MGGASNAQGLQRPDLRNTGGSERPKRPLAGPMLAPTPSHESYTPGRHPLGVSVTRSTKP